MTPSKVQPLIKFGSKKLKRGMPIPIKRVVANGHLGAFQIMCSLHVDEDGFHVHKITLLPHDNSDAFEVIVYDKAIAPNLLRTVIEQNMLPGGTATKLVRVKPVLEAALKTVISHLTWEENIALFSAVFKSGKSLGKQDFKKRFKQLLADN